MLRLSQIMEVSSRLRIKADCSTLSVTQYRHAELYLLIKEWVLTYQNSEALEKCGKKAGVFIVNPSH